MTNFDTIDLERPSQARGGILKRSLDRPAEPAGRSLKWDETAIAEHDRLRGSRMKIVEPNTPYHYYVQEPVSDEDEDPPATAPEIPTSTVPKPALKKRTGSHECCEVPFDAEELRERLERLQQAEASRSVSISFEESSEDKDPSNCFSKKHLTFEARRKAHYNEFRLLKELRDSSDSLLEEEPSEESEKRLFELKRKAHYNEFRLVKEMREKGAISEDEDSVP